MNEKELTKSEVLKLKDGEKYVVPESDYGKAEIWLKNGMYFLYEIPMFGGEPVFRDMYSPKGMDEMIELIFSWT